MLSNEIIPYLHSSVLKTYVAKSGFDPVNMS